MSILKPKAQDKTRPLSIRVPGDLHAQIDALRAEAEAAGLVFDIADVCTKALTAAVKQARAELVNNVHNP